MHQRHVFLEHCVPARGLFRFVISVRGGLLNHGRVLGFIRPGLSGGTGFL